MDSLYDHPDMYQAVMARPPDLVDAETGQLRRLFAQHGIEQRGNVLELCAGSCPHGLRLARSGYNMTGLDSSSALLGEAQRLAEEEGLAIQLAHGDVRDFSVAGPCFDAAIFMFETFAIIHKDDDVRSHFECVRQHMRPGGLYVIDNDFKRCGFGREHSTWGQKTVRIEGGHIEVWCEDWPGDVIEGTFHMAMHCRMVKGAATTETCDEWHIRVDTPHHLRWLVGTLEGWSLERFCSWRDIFQEPREEDEHYWMVLRRG